MQVEIVVNGGVTLVLLPQNEMEERMLQELDRQDNSINLIRSSVMILNKTISNGLIISKKSVSITANNEPVVEASYPKEDEGKIKYEGSEETV